MKKVGGKRNLEHRALCIKYLTRKYIWQSARIGRMKNRSIFPKKYSQTCKTFSRLYIRSHCFTRMVFSTLDCFTLRLMAAVVAEVPRNPFQDPISRLHAACINLLLLLDWKRKFAVRGRIEGCLDYFRNFHFSAAAPYERNWLSAKLSSRSIVHYYAYVAFSPTLNFNMLKWKIPNNRYFA